MTTTADQAAAAAAMEADADKYPAERYEILLEAAGIWRTAGRLDRARELLTEVIAAGGEDGCYARCELAEVEFAVGADGEAYAELDRLARDPALGEGQCTLVAELLAERGDLAAALQWYDRAVARLTPEEIEALRGPNGWMQMSSVVVRGRREIRHRLGLPADATDEIAPVAPLQQMAASVGEPTTLDEARHAFESGRVPQQLRLLVFQRAERAEARRRWPDTYTDSDEEHYPAAERRWRELADSGVPAIRVVPATVAGLSEFAEQIGESPLDPAVKTRYARLAAEQNTIVWPPSRNDPCWCGSGTKYKKCCGRAGLGA
ncbi:SEC-C metal-binding domain-containing protein [Solwaraspora sp. WMMB335]|uniref:SEC-C metal-binding domain-containing protein n=1 Tax=Solwaraspora sp. WMMB335 TaxID=3404118 RepID=UPI003B96609D